MKKTNKVKESRKTTRRKKSDRRNIVGNFKGSEDIFWTKVVKGFKKFLEPAFKPYNSWTSK